MYGIHAASIQHRNPDFANPANAPMQCPEQVQQRRPWRSVGPCSWEGRAPAQAGGRERVRCAVLHVHRFLAWQGAVCVVGEVGRASCGVRTGFLLGREAVGVGEGVVCACQGCCAGGEGALAGRLEWALMERAPGHAAASMHTHTCTRKCTHRHAQTNTQTLKPLIPYPAPPSPAGMPTYIQPLEGETILRATPEGSKAGGRRKSREGRARPTLPHVCHTYLADRAGSGCLNFGCSQVCVWMCVCGARLKFLTRHGVCCYLSMRGSSQDAQAHTQQTAWLQPLNLLPHACCAAPHAIRQ